MKRWVTSFTIIIMSALIAAIVLPKAKKVSDMMQSPPIDTPLTVAPAFTPFTAKFEIYTKGLKRVFTDKKYHNKSEKVYIEFPDPQLVHIYKPNVTWQAFFDTLPMELTPNCLVTGTGQKYCTGKSGTLNFYLNGSLDQLSLEKTINANDELVVKFE